MRRTVFENLSENIVVSFAVTARDVGYSPVVRQLSNVPSRRSSSVSSAFSESLSL